MAMYYKKYFIPIRVADEFKNRIEGGITIPIIKRKLSAMIYATMDTRIMISDNVFMHVFGDTEIIVEEENKVIREVKYTIGKTLDDKQSHIYRKICWNYGLNKVRDDFEIVI